MYLDLFNGNGNVTSGCKVWVDTESDYKKVAERIKNSDYWSDDDVATLAYHAGILDEYVDAESIEEIAEKAADILGVEIL